MSVDLRSDWRSFGWTVFSGRVFGGRVLSGRVFGGRVPLGGVTVAPGPLVLVIVLGDRVLLPLPHRPVLLHGTLHQVGHRRVRGVVRTLRLIGVLIVLIAPNAARTRSCKCKPINASCMIGKRVINEYISKQSFLDFIAKKIIL